MAEWRSFRDRETLLNLFTDAATLGLVYPVLYADGEFFPPDAAVTQCRGDFGRLNYPDDIFRATAKYLECDELIKAMVEDLVRRLAVILP